MEPTLFYIGLHFLVSFIHLASSKVSSYSDWNSSPDAQYHIQTDEGEERYFKYQTISGQYRKEKRLQDGTVVGTSGWVDPNGFLRLQDYVADNAGYRIVNTKLIYVGKNSLTDENKPQEFDYENPSRRPSAHYSSKVDREKNNVPAPLYSSSTPAAEMFPYLLSDPQETSPAYYSKNEIFDATSDAINKPINAYASPLQPETINLYPQSSSGFVSHIPQSNSVTESNLQSLASNNYYSTTPLPVYSKQYGYFDSNNNLLSERERNKLRVEEYENDYGKRYSPNQPGYQVYDGISTVQNGFRYFLPRHYHEETVTDNSQGRAGSFGYIDPFGIRRVIYYNTSPGKGFVHKKNNRYVGFAATPYDPRPNF